MPINWTTQYLTQFQGTYLFVKMIREMIKKNAQYYYWPYSGLIYAVQTKPDNELDHWKNGNEIKNVSKICLPNATKV